jgi:hypothetical protein
VKSSAGALALDEKRSVWRIVGSALVLYGRYPLLFAILAVVVVAPYDLLARLELATSWVRCDWSGAAPVVKRCGFAGWFARSWANAERCVVA